MRAGLLRKRVTIQQSVNTQNSYGEVSKLWSTLTTRWAQVIIKGGGEGELSGAIREQADVEFLIRKLTGVTTQMQAVYDGNTYNIISVKSDQWGKSTRLLARLA